jgi:ketosteroid isomerase-like protein
MGIDETTTGVAAGNRALISEAFAAWAGGDSRPFFALVADDVNWTVIGSTSISGTFTSKQAFMDGAAGPLTARLAEPIRATVRNVLVDGDNVVLQWEGRSTGVNGRPYDQHYCWVMRLAEGRVVECTAYLDTALILAMFA